MAGAYAVLCITIPVQDRWAIITYIRALQLSLPTEYSRRFGKPGACSFADANIRRTSMIQQSFNPPNMSDFQKRALIVGIVFLVALVASAFVNSHHFFESYLIGWTFWTGITTWPHLRS